MSQLADLTAAYQSLLEGHRRLDATDDLELHEHVTEDLDKARAAMEIAWLEHTTR